MPEGLAATALIDTGADITCVAPWIAERLEIPSHGEIELGVVGGEPRRFPTKDIGIAFIAPAPEYDHLTLPSHMVVEAEVRGADALIGQDILSRCTFSQNGRQQKFTLAWRVPRR